MGNLSIDQAQTEIMRWLRSIGHATIDNYMNDAKTRGCTSKRKYASALQAAMSGPSMDVYKCRYCEGWHLTTPRGKP